MARVHVPCLQARAGVPHQGRHRRELAVERGTVQRRRPAPERALGHGLAVPDAGAVRAAAAEVDGPLADRLGLGRGDARVRTVAGQQLQKVRITCERKREGGRGSGCVTV